MREIPAEQGKKCSKHSAHDDLPSAPIFQKRILNARVSPSAGMSSGTISLIVAWNAMLLLNAPDTIVAYTENGLYPIQRIKRPPATMASSTEPDAAAEPVLRGALFSSQHEFRGSFFLVSSISLHPFPFDPVIISPSSSFVVTAASTIPVTSP